MIFLAIAAIIFFGCHENVVISSKIAPANNAINVYDTALPVITHTYFDDTAVTSTNISGLPVYEAIGSITDPFFGTMIGATFFNVEPDGNLLDTSFFTNNIIDSVALELPYSGFTYGDSSNTSLTQTYQVFYMADTMGYNTTYFSYNSKAVNTAFPLSNPYTVNVTSVADSFAINFLPADYAGIRIPLNKNTTIGLLRSALPSIANAGDPIQNFVNTFNGICVRVADSRKSSTAIPYFELDGVEPYSAAGILIYYHAVGTAAGDTSLVASFYFDPSYCAHFNSIAKSYSHFPVNNLLRSTQANDSVIALQNQPGASIDIKIPGISHLPAGVINKAEIRFPILPNYNSSTFQGPSNVFPTGVGNGTYPALITAGLTYVVADYFPLSSTTPLTVLDGFVHQMPNGTYAYTIDIPREVMASIQAKNDTLHLQINGTQQFYGAFHFVGGGGSYADTSLRPKLFVVYSKLTY
jgi:uncharacterized protein DUF4270